MPVRLRRLIPFFISIALFASSNGDAAPPWPNDPPRADSIEWVQDSILGAAYEALAGDSTLVDEYVRIAGIHKARKNWTQELRVAERLIRINPYNAVANFTFADALLDNSLPDSAILHLCRALHMEPEFARARTTLADAYMMKKAYDSALMQLDTALLLNPRYAQAHFQRALVLGTIGRDAEAAESYRIAAELTPESFSMWMALARALLKTNDYDQAVEVLAYLRQLRPGSADAAYLYAEISMKLGRVEEAAKAFEEFMLNFPRDRRALDAERLARRIREGTP